jgi:hypothetical protein
MAKYCNLLKVKPEMNLTNVAKGSLGELEQDYLKHLMRRKLRCRIARRRILNRMAGFQSGSAKSE